MVQTLADLSRLNLVAVLNSLPSGVTFANAEGKIIFSNTAADRILGVGAATEKDAGDWAEYYGVFLGDGSTPFPAEQYPLVRALAGETTHDVEMIVRNSAIPDGATLAVSGQSLRNGAGEIVGAAVVFRDVTALRKAEKMREELSAFIVHDLKNPLATVLAACGLLEASGLADQALADVAIIRSATERTHRMVLDLLDIQMAADGALRLELAPIRLDDLFADVSEAAASRLMGRAQKLVLGATGGLSVIADRPHLFRVLMNLVDNCAKYGRKGGVVTVDAVPTGPKQRVIRVSDDGPGVPPALRERIFDKYAQAERAEGMRSHHSRGLGLRFCKVVIDAHGGRIWVEDASPSGARFCVELPAA